MKLRRKTQELKILEALVRARGSWVGAPELAIISLQYGRAVHTLRKKLGLTIENRLEIGADGGKRGYFRLRGGVPARKAVTPAENLQQGSPIEAAPAAPDSLFGDLSPESSYPD